MLGEMVVKFWQGIETGGIMLLYVSSPSFLGAEFQSLSTLLEFFFFFFFVKVI